MYRTFRVLVPLLSSLYKCIVDAQISKYFSLLNLYECGRDDYACSFLGQTLFFFAAMEGRHGFLDSWLLLNLPWKSFFFIFFLFKSCIACTSLL